MTETPKPWTADQKLRADATDEQMDARFRFICYSLEPVLVSAEVRFAREFAAACVEQARICDCGKTLSRGPCGVCDNDE